MPGHATFGDGLTGHDVLQERCERLERERDEARAEVRRLTQLLYGEEEEESPAPR